MLKIKNYYSLCDNVYEGLELLAPFRNTSVTDSLNIIKQALPFTGINRLPRCLEEDHAALYNLASNSYLHENGFYKLTIIDRPDAKFRVRLHFWPFSVSSSVEEENIHNHRFNYYSCILKGVLLNKIWRIAPRGSKFRHYKYIPRTQKQSYVLDYCGEHFLEMHEESKYQSGDLYSMCAEDLHTVNVAQTNNVITLFIEERTGLKSHADVFSNRYALGYVPISSPSLTLNQYLKVLSIIISLLRVKTI